MSLGVDGESDARKVSREVFDILSCFQGKLTTANSEPVTEYHAFITVAVSGRLIAIGARLSDLQLLVPAGEANQQVHPAIEVQGLDVIKYFSIGQPIKRNMLA